MTVSCYFIGELATERPGFLRATLRSKIGKEVEIGVDVAALKSALAESSGVGIFAIQLPQHTGPSLVAVCGREVDPGTRQLTKLVLREVRGLDRVQVRMSVGIDELPPAAKEGRAIVVQAARGPAVQATVATIQSGLAVSLSKACVGDSIKARDLPLPEDMRLVSDPEEVIFRVETSPGKAVSH